VSRSATVVLGSCALLLAAAVGGEAWYLWGTSSPTPSPQRPVVIGDIDAQAVVDTAATDAAVIFSTSWRRYDAHLARATSLMTTDMATRYRTTAAPVRSRVVSGRTSTVTRVAASGVVRATSAEVLALLFLDQRTTTRGGAPSYAARRALVTMVHTDRGWLVANVQTR
jgi:Mce-associated membrane protein